MNRMSISPAISRDGASDSNTDTTINVGRWAVWGTTVVLVSWMMIVYAGLVSGSSTEAFFAPINTLVSGLALLGVLIAVVLQRQELEAQRREFHGTRVAHEQLAADSKLRFDFEKSLFDKQLEAAADQRRQDTTFGMHREFNSESMHRSRNIAGEIVEKFPTFSVDEYHRQLPSEQSVHLSHVMGFYYRLALLVKHGQVEMDYVSELFGRNLLWWWVNLCEGRAAPDWENVQGIESLVQAVQEKSPDEYRRWLDRAQSMRKGYLDRYNASKATQSGG
jgi:hypothetical protein